MAKHTVEAGARRWVIKVGSSLVTDSEGGLNHAVIHDWARQVARLKRENRQIVLVSSGSIAEGVRRMGWESRPRRLNEVQAAAAVGQTGLIHAYEAEFSRHRLHAAQVLLSHEDFNSRERYLNARSTLTTLLGLDVVPVVNENDVVATEEIRLGDNDMIAALTANLIDADNLLILTDRAGLYDADPARDANAQLVESIALEDPRLDRMAGPGTGALGRGGMVTKISAARRAALSGTGTRIAFGHEERIIERIVYGEQVGTRLYSDKPASAARKQWIAGLKSCGTLTLNDGACAALIKGGNSLLPVGITSVAGAFGRGDPVVCCDAGGRVIAYGLTNYAADEIRRIMGKRSEEVSRLVTGGYEPSAIHYDNMTVIA